MPEKIYLMSPGPTNIPESTLKAMQIRSMHHRSDEFSELLTRLFSNLKTVFQTNNPVLPLHCTGRGAIEATIINLLRRDDEIISICNGRFGCMYADIAEKFGITVHRICNDWEKDVDLVELRSALEMYPNVKAVTSVHCETSTAVINDIESIARLVHEYDKLIMVDCVSSLGGVPFHCDKWNVDVALTASQKALMGPTGLSFVTLSDRAWKSSETSDFPKSYLNLSAVLKNLQGKRPETPGSTPVQLVAAMVDSTNMILQEGLDAVWERHHSLSVGLKAALEALGFRLFPDVVAKRSDTLSAAWMPDGLTPSHVNQPMKDMFGIVAKGGLLQYKEKVLRIGHMGDFFQFDAMAYVAALEFAMRRLGRTKSMGAGLEALARFIEVK